MSDRPAPIALDQTLGTLLNRVDYAQTEPLFTGGNSQPLAPGITLHLDPDARMTGQWSSPDGRLIEIQTKVTQPGAWFGLHIGLPDAALDLTALRWIGVTARTSAQRGVGVRVALRSGHAGGGFQDDFFGRHMLSQARQSDHQDLLCPADLPDLPTTAPWRELVLFLPPAAPLHWALHDLRIFGL